MERFRVIAIKDNKEKSTFITEIKATSFFMASKILLIKSKNMDKSVFDGIQLFLIYKLKRVTSPYSRYRLIDNITGVPAYLHISQLEEYLHGKHEISTS